MNDKNLSQLRYVILPGNPSPESPALQMQNAAYDYWKLFWNRVFEQNNATHEMSYGSIFSRMDVIAMIMAGENIAALHLYGFFNLKQNAHCEHGYFQSNPGASAFLDELRAQNVDHVMSMEYLTVDPAWRKREIGISLASVLASLGTRVQVAGGAGASTGIARRDVGVDAMGREIGGIEIGERISMYNTPITFMCMFSNRLKELDDPRAKSLVNTLWEERTDFTGLYGTGPRLKIAA